MLTTKEAIEQRRSIRKFKPDPIPDEHISELLEAARLAPSGSNGQPWRFKIVKDQETKLELAKAAHNQKFIGEAPVVWVCVADIKGYLNRWDSTLQDLGKIGAVEDRVVKLIVDHHGKMRTMSLEELGSYIAFNMAIAGEHIVLRALDFGLGTCWIRFMDVERIKDLFGWDDNIFVAALLPMGYPNESPAPRRRIEINDILIK